MHRKLYWPLICTATIGICGFLAWAHESRGRTPAVEVEVEPEAFEDPVPAVSEPLPPPPVNAAVVALPVSQTLDAPPASPAKLISDTPPPSLSLSDNTPASPVPVVQVVPIVPPAGLSEPPSPTAPDLPPPLSPPTGGSVALPQPPPTSGTTGLIPDPSSTAPPTPLLPPTPTPPIPQPLPVACPWTFQVAVVQGRTQFEARTGQDVQFTVICDKLNMQTPDGTIQASGGVKVTGPNVEGTCEKLTLTWHEERVLLDGKVQLKCQQHGQDVHLTGDHLSVKLAAIETIPPPTLVETKEMPSVVDSATTPN